MNFRKTQLVFFFYTLQPEDQKHNEERLSNGEDKSSGSTYNASSSARRRNNTKQGLHSHESMTSSVTLRSLPNMDGSKIDSMSRILFPVVFTLFTLGYWLAYQYLPEDNIEFS